MCTDELEQAEVSVVEGASRELFSVVSYFCRGTSSMRPFLRRSLLVNLGLTVSRLRLVAVLPHEYFLGGLLRGD